MKAYGRKPQHPKGYPSLGLRKPLRPWWEGEGAQPEKHVARTEGKREINEQAQEAGTVLETHVVPEKHKDCRTCHESPPSNHGRLCDTHYMEAQK